MMIPIWDCLEIYMNIIKTEQLTKIYQMRVKEEGLKASIRGLIKPEWHEVEAVKQISLEVEKGEIIAFIGPNGAGKSTYIKMLCGILHPTAGDVSVLGLSPTKDRKKLTMQIGTVFGQKSQLWMHLPVLDSFKLLSAIYEISNSEYKKRVDELTELFGLSGLLKTPVRKLSLGQRVRCEVAASLLHEPELLFLDEPTIGLDVVVKQAIRELILHRNKERGTTVFLTSHDPADIEHLCQRAVVIDNGSLVLDSSIEKLRRDYLGKKLIELNFTKPQVVPLMEGVEILSQEDNVKYTLEVDTKLRPIGEVMTSLSGLGNVMDITINNPPMEDIIAAMYKERGV